MNIAPAAPDPARLEPAALARLLSAAGGQVISPEMIHADVAAGAPVNADGSLNLVIYAAWLARGHARPRRGGSGWGGG